MVFSSALKRPPRQGSNVRKTHIAPAGHAYDDDVAYELQQVIPFSEYVSELTTEEQERASGEARVEADKVDHLIEGLKTLYNATVTSYDDITAKIYAEEDKGEAADHDALDQMYARADQLSNDKDKLLQDISDLEAVLKKLDFTGQVFRKVQLVKKLFGARTGEIRAEDDETRQQLDDVNTQIDESEATLASLREEQDQVQAEIQTLAQERDDTKLQIEQLTENARAIGQQYFETQQKYGQIVRDANAVTDDLKKLYRLQLDLKRKLGEI